ncbi:MAG: pyridoxamine 5'-phosphate oxidase [Verrucomicrobiales bacterium]|jgi:pyridoxamine 5'-phosphate oxidase|nr:pyridoxamine 5'-phosphate oxidase [Verrucomicrobiales bacterium]
MSESISLNIADLRREYATRGLRREDLAENPVAQFRAWFKEAQAAELLEPNAMSLATAGADGRVTARMVLLKAFDERGFVFFTNYDSAKARQMAENERVALLFPWLALERQVSVSGRVEKISAAESLAYFASRPFGSRLGAWISQQSRVIPSRKLLELKFEEMRRKFANGEVPLPGFWGGYRVAPLTVEFWQGAASRLHDRFQYSRGADGEWVIERLSP